MIIDEAIDVLRIEAKGILNLIDRIDENFEKMVELLVALIPGSHARSRLFRFHAEMLCHQSELR